MAVGAVVLAVATVLAVLGALRTGVTTDEPIHVMRLRNFFDTGWYALDWDYGGAGPGGDGTNTYVYAPVTMLLLHAWSVLWGVEGWHDVATTSHAYDVRHLGVVVIGLVGVAAVAAIGRVVLRQLALGAGRGRRAGRDPDVDRARDVQRQGRPGRHRAHPGAPSGCCCFVRDAPARWPAPRWAGPCCLVAGLVLTLGTRPGHVVGPVGRARGRRASGCSLAPTTRRTAVVALAELAASCGAGGRRPRGDLPEPLRLTAAGAAPHQRVVVELPRRREVGPALRAAPPGRGDADPAHWRSR